MDKIILQTFNAYKNVIKYQEGCFELFGFDALFDEGRKLWLLEVNLNPACSSERD